MQLKNLKSYMMPISMLIGIIFYIPMSKFSFITQYLLFFMLLLSYTNISLKSIKLKKVHFLLLSMQLVVSILAYIILQFSSPIIAQGAMICILAPTATSAIVITGILGGNTASVTSYSILSNLTIALVAPIIISLINSDSEISIWYEFFQISKQVFIFLLLPFIISVLLDRIFPSLHQKIKSTRSISFILWNIALVVVTARTVTFLLEQGRTHLLTALILFLLALLICVSQFIIGRRLGKCYGDKIACGQGFGQKNTILAIWIAQTYLIPFSSIAPGAYILWQNVINSYQVWKQQHQKTVS